MAEFSEIANGVFVLRYPVLDVNVTLLVGQGAALLVDTLATAEQAGELAVAVRRITPAPLTIVNTHHHFDHCFGNATLASEGAGERADAETPIWAHDETVRLLRERVGSLPREGSAAYAGSAPELAAAIAAVTVRPPNRAVHTESTVDVGGRVARLLHVGRGHTAGDLVVHLPDAGVLVAGDLIEEGAPPDFDEAYPIAWPETVAALLPLLGAPPGVAALPAARPGPPGECHLIVPGHGAVVGPDFVRAQHAALTELAWLIREGDSNGSPPEQVAARAPFAGEAAVTAIRRGYAELNGRLG